MGNITATELIRGKIPNDSASLNRPSHINFLRGLIMGCTHRGTIGDITSYNPANPFETFVQRQQDEITTQTLLPVKIFGDLYHVAIDLSLADYDYQALIAELGDR